MTFLAVAMAGATSVLIAVELMRVSRIPGLSHFSLSMMTECAFILRHSVFLAFLFDIQHDCFDASVT